MSDQVGFYYSIAEDGNDAARYECYTSHRLQIPGFARWAAEDAAEDYHGNHETGLPIDFQFQPQSIANEQHKGPRSAIGIRVNAVAEDRPDGQ